MNRESGGTVPVPGRHRTSRRGRRLLGFVCGIVGLLVFAYVYLQSPFLWFVHVEAGRIPEPAPGTQRILVIAPHPDDDVLSAGGELALAVEGGDSVLVVFLTNGDANRAGERLITMTPFHSARAYRALGGRRQKEAVLALGKLGVTPENALFLNYPDRGLINLVVENALCDTPYRSRFTEADAKYSSNAFNPGLSYCGENLLADLEEIMESFRPTVIYVPHPLDAHPDHAAGYYFGVLAAQRALARDADGAPKTVRCYMTHVAHRPWPWPKGIGLGYAFELLPVYIEEDPWESIPLPKNVEQLKLAAVRSHTSQWWTSRPTLEAFVRQNEIYMVVNIAGMDGVPRWPAASGNGSLARATDGGER